MNLLPTSKNKITQSEKVQNKEHKNLASHFFQTIRLQTDKYNAVVITLNSKSLKKDGKTFKKMIFKMC